VRKVLRKTSIRELVAPDHLSFTRPRERTAVRVILRVAVVVEVVLGVVAVVVFVGLAVPVDGGAGVEVVRRIAAIADCSVTEVTVAPVAGSMYGFSRVTVTAEPEGLTITVPALKSRRQAAPTW
jgi:hypothetical protein